MNNLNAIETANNWQAQHNTNAEPNGSSRDKSESETVTEHENRRLEAMTVLLRSLGAILLLSAALVFAVQKMGSLSSLGRYFSFLGLTGAIAVAGAISVLRLKDPKGARTLFAVATTFLPALFVQLGALIYAYTLGGPADVNSLFILFEPDLYAIIGTALLSFVVLLPTAFTGFSALVRSESKQLTLWYLLFNFVLLIPSRTPFFTTVIALTILFALIFLEVSGWSSEVTMKTKEGRISRGILWLPLFFILGRSILYPQTDVFAALVCSVISAILFISAPKVTISQATATFLQGISAFFACLSWLLLSQGLLFDRYQGLLYQLFGWDSQQLIIPVTSIGISVILFVLSCYTVKPGRRYRSSAALIATGGALVQLLSIPGISSSFFCIGVSTLTLILAFALEEKGIFYSSIACLTLGLLYHLRYAAELYYMSPWISLALGGIAIVLISSYIEKNFSSLLARSMQFRQRFARWN